MDSSSIASSNSSNNQSTTQKMCLACNQTFPGALTHCPKDNTPLISFGHDENLNRVINDKYKIIELVGKGGMGSVYLAEDLSRPGTYVAVKMLHAQLSEDKVSVKRFQQEASAASDLHHPNLIQQHDYGMIDGKTPYLVMEYLQGESLAEIIKEQGPLNPLRVVKIFSQVMDGLGYAHNAGVLHRDIKPSNILLLKKEGSNEEIVKVVDFGLAKLMPWSGKESQHLTKTGEVFGSPIYMSPEQCMGKPLQETSDIYSLGITLFETLTGKPPFKGQNVVQTASKHLSDPPPTFESVCPELNLPQNLQTVVFTALEKEPLHRFLNMNEFRSALVYAVTGQGQVNARVQAAMTADATQPVKKVDLDNMRSSSSISNLRGASSAEAKKTPLALIAGAVAGLLLLGGAVFMFMPKDPSQKGSLPPPRVQVPHHATGTVYFLAMKAVPSKGGKNRYFNHISEVHLQTPDLGLVKLTCDISPHSPLDLQIGKEWEVNYEGDDSGGRLETYHSSEKVLGDVGEANNLVENYFADLAEKDYVDVFSMLSDDFIAKTYKGLSPEQALKKFSEEKEKQVFQNYRNETDKISDSSIPALTLPTGEKLPPAQATKVASVGTGEIVIMVDTAMFYFKSHGYESFTVKKGDSDWKIDQITSISKEQWDSK